MRAPPPDVDELKAAIERAEATRGALPDATDAMLAALIQPLEACGDVEERVAASPLLDGWWRSVYASHTPQWAEGSTDPLVFGIESYLRPPGDGLATRGVRRRKGLLTCSSPASPGLIRGPAGAAWSDVSGGRCALAQRARGRLGFASEVRATYTWLGGEVWELAFVSRARLLLGMPLWMRSLRRRGRDLDPDLDHGIRPTYVDGELLVLRTPPVSVGELELRPARVYLMRRLRNRLWQDGGFMGLTDRIPMGVEP